MKLAGGYFTPGSKLPAEQVGETVVPASGFGANHFKALNVPPLDISTHEFGGAKLPPRPGFIRYHELVRYIAREQDAIVRELLGRWVSELEPCVISQEGGGIVGLGMAGDPTGFVAVRVQPEHRKGQ